MIDVKLYGYLKEQYGSTLQLDVNSVSECIRALCANFSDFRKDFIKEKFYILVDRVSIGYNEVINLINGHTIEIIPLVHGASGSFLKILVGAALIGASFLVPGAGVFASFASSFLFGTGVALILGGISELLFSPKKADDEDQDKNYAFGGPINSSRQGAGVPIAYGKIMAGSSVISAGLHS